jgi:hypothetical protein
MPRISDLDVQTSRQRISAYLSTHTAYELLPESGKVWNFNHWPFIQDFTFFCCQTRYLESHNLLIFTNMVTSGHRLLPWMLIFQWSKHFTYYTSRYLWFSYIEDFLNRLINSAQNVWSLHVAFLPLIYPWQISNMAYMHFNSFMEFEQFLRSIFPPIFKSSIL